MIELRNRQYMTILDCVASGQIQVGQVLRLQANTGSTGLGLMASVATASGHVNAIIGPMIAHWINDRSTATQFTGTGDGITFTNTAASDEDALEFIPSGTNMLAIGGRGVAEVRFFKSSLDTEFASTLPLMGQTLDFSTDESKLSSTGNGQAAGVDVGFVVEVDSVSVAVLLG